MSKLVLFVCLTLAVSCFAYDTSFPSFMKFVRDHNKEYATFEEFQNRFNIFQDNGKRVEQLRASHLKSTGESGEIVYGINKFSDVDPAEFKARYLNYKPSAQNLANRASAPVVEAPQVSALPTSWDWRKQGKVTPVKDQGQCGSCWAFSATEEIETAWLMANNTQQILAPQQIVSCDTVDGGCNGGDTTTAYAYVEKAGGLETEADYPYESGVTGLNGKCKFNQADIVVKISGFKYATAPCSGACNSQNLTELANSLVNVAPISICVYAESWQYYTGGILKTDCPHAFTDLDHCVQLVGYAQTTASPPVGYWIIRNSWNTDWGLDGYINVATANNLCGVADEATIVTL